MITFVDLVVSDEFRLDVAGVDADIVRGKVTTPKNHHVRNVDLSRKLRAVLYLYRRKLRAEWFAKGLPMPKWVFPSSAGTPLDPSNTRKDYLRILDRAEVRHRRIHDLRHTYASHLIRQGESLVYVRDQLGHSSIQITVDVYGHLVPGGNRAAVDRLDETPSKRDRVANELQTRPAQLRRSA